MKKILILLFLIVTFFCANAQAPQNQVKTRQLTVVSNIDSPVLKTTLAGRVNIYSGVAITDSSIQAATTQFVKRQNYLKGSFNRFAIPFGSSTGNLTQDSAAFNLTNGSLSLNSGSFNSIFLNNLRTEMQGNFNGFIFNVGSGYPGGGNYDQSKSYQFMNRGNVYLSMATAGAVSTSTFNTNLVVNGSLKITGGVPGAGKVLTSDAVGLASWQVPSGGGGSTDTTNLSNRINKKLDTSELYGTIYNKNSWTDLSDFTNVGATVSVVSNKLSFSGGTAPFNAGNNTPFPANYLKLNGNTNLDRWQMTAKVKVNQVPSSTSYGFAIGIVGANAVSTLNRSSALGFFNMSTTGLTGKGSLVLGASNWLITSSPIAITFSQNDFIVMKVERVLDVIYVSAWNQTTNSAVVTASYTYNTTVATGSGIPFTQNDGNFGIVSNGGAFIVDSINITSNVVKRANLMVIGDSKVIYNGAYDISFGQLLRNNYPGTVVHAGPIDYTQSVINELPEIITLNPKKIFICVGRNDLALGISTATWQQNIITIDSTLTAAGIRTIWGDGFYETSQSQTTLTNFIDTLTRLSGRVIKTYVGTTLEANLSSDNIHPSTAGHFQIYNILLGSGLLKDDAKYVNDSYTAKMLSQTFTNVRYSGNLIAGGGTARFPTTVLNGDIIMADGNSLATAFATNVAWYGKVKPFNGGRMDFVNSFASANAFSFYGANGVNGTETLVANISDKGRLKITGFQTAISTINGGITLTEVYSTVNCITNSFTVTLPIAVGIAGTIYTIKNSTSGTTITVATTSSQTIDGATTYLLAAQYKYVTVQSDGANWIVISNN